MGLVERFLCFFTSQVFIPQIYKHKMVICSIADEMIIPFYKCLCHCLGICYYLFTVISEFVCKNFTKGYCFSCDNMFKRSALHTRKYGKVKYTTHHPCISFRVFYPVRVFKIIAQHNNTTPGASQCFMRGGCYNMTVIEWIIQ